MSSIIELLLSKAAFIFPFQRQRNDASIRRLHVVRLHFLGHSRRNKYSNLFKLRVRDFKRITIRCLQLEFSQVT